MSGPGVARAGVPAGMRPWGGSRPGGQVAWAALIGTAWASALTLMLLMAARIHAPLSEGLVVAGSAAAPVTQATLPGLDPAASALAAAAVITWCATATIIGAGVALARPGPRGAARLLGLGVGLGVGTSLMPLMGIVSALAG